MDNEEKKRKKRTVSESLTKAAIEGAAAETVQQYGSAVKQHYVAYSGIDHEAEKVLQKSLKSISESKLSPEYMDQNIKQQSGFSAEVKSVARKNAQNIIDKEKTRFSRTDDLNSVNDTLFDIKEVNETGSVIEGSGAQMKFVGNSPDELLKKLNGKKFQKYLDADAILDIADDDYDILMGKNGKGGIIDQEITKLQDQVEKAKQRGDGKLVESKQKQLNKYIKIKKSLRKSGLTREEAIEARLHPALSTAKDVAKIAHKAGKEQMKYGAVISFSVSLIKNMVAFAKGEKTLDEGASEILIDTGKGISISYVTAAVGTTIKGAMQNASSSYLRALSKTNLASGLVTTTMDVGKTIHRYFKGDIDEAEFVEELGERGLGEIGAAVYYAIGKEVATTSASALLEAAGRIGSSSGISTIGIFGGIIGATFGYAAAVAVYKELSISLKEAKFAREERIRVEAECAEAVKMIQQYRNEMNIMVAKYLSGNIQVFLDGFEKMDEAILENDPDGFIRGNIEIQNCLGKEAQFTNLVEFNRLMNSDIPLKL